MPLEAVLRDVRLPPWDQLNEKRRVSVNTPSIEEMKEYCPPSWAQHTGRYDLKPKFPGCVALGQNFNQCSHWTCKANCWELWFDQRQEGVQQEYPKPFLENVFAETGMDPSVLRDFFAGCALAGYCGTDHGCTVDEIATLTYNQADAMLAAREE